MKGAESIIRLFILMAALTGILWVHAEKFDATEIRALCYFFVGASSLEGGTSYLRTLLGSKQPGQRDRTDTTEPELTDRP